MVAAEFKTVSKIHRPKSSNAAPSLLYKFCNTNSIFSLPLDERIFKGIKREMGK
jgi:hypothetical protein